MTNDPSGAAREAYSAWRDTQGWSTPSPAATWFAAYEVGAAEERAARSPRDSDLEAAAQKAYDWGHIDLKDWDAKYGGWWGSVDDERDIWEPLRAALGPAPEPAHPEPTASEEA